MEKTTMFLAVALIACLTACSGAPAPESATEDNSATAPEVAREVGAIHAEVMEKMARMMDEAPDVATLLPQVRAYHKQVLDRLHELGRQREGFDRAGRAIVDAAVSSSRLRLAPDIVLTFADGQRRFSGNAELAGLISDLSEITQWVAFDRVRTQKPELARQWGID